MSKGKLYTTYFAKHKKAIGEKISIVQFTPKWLDLDKEDITNIKELAPSKQLLLSYKNSNCDWNTYKNLFISEMRFRSDMMFALTKIKSLLDKGNDITLICFEKDRNVCHRSFIGGYFSELGYEVKEIE